MNRIGLTWCAVLLAAGPVTAEVFYSTDFTTFTASDWSIADYSGGNGPSMAWISSVDALVAGPWKARACYAALVATGATDLLDCNVTATVRQAYQGATYATDQFIGVGVRGSVLSTTGKFVTTPPGAGVYPDGVYVRLYNNRYSYQADHQQRATITLFDGDQVLATLEEVDLNNFNYDSVISLTVEGNSVTADVSGWFGNDWYEPIDDPEAVEYTLSGTIVNSTAAGDVFITGRPHFDAGGSGDTARPRVDDITVAEPTGILGDVNGDGVVDGLDIQPFVDLLTGGGYQAEADINSDAVVDGLDIQPFVDIITGAGGESVPEPATMLLLAFGGLAAMRRRRR